MSRFREAWECAQNIFACFKKLVKKAKFGMILEQFQEKRHAQTLLLVYKNVSYLLSLDIRDNWTFN